MAFNKIIQPSVGAEFIAPTADLSALGACSGIRIILLICIIDLFGIFIHTLPGAEAGLLQRLFCPMRRREEGR